ncbi:MAG: FAD-dependent oxidoreductase, partial [Methanosarcinaceae archaeon]
LTLSTFGMDLSNQSVYDSLPQNLSKDTYDFVNAISYFLSGKSMKETSVHRMLTGSSFIRDSITQDQFESIVGQGETPQHTESILKSILHSNLRTSLGLKLTGILESSILVKSTVPNPLASISRFATSSNTAQAQGYPRKGLKAVLNAVLYSLPETVEIKTQCKVKRILTNEGKVIGVETDQAHYADLVIYTGFAKDLPDIVEDLPISYVDDLGKIVQTKSLTIWLGLDRKMDEFNYIGSEIWFKDTPYWAMPISNFDQSLAPKGKQLVGFVFVMDENKSEEFVVKRAYDTIYRALPPIERHIEMKHEQITIPEKAAVTIHGKFADIRTPIKNLYLAGTDTDNRSMGITRASYSIIEMLGALNGDGNLH